ncbi:MAG: hypothetical protein HFG70_08565 [Hungatella sp.]|nr:hypothetical protein [Hungatella sp.]
MKKSRFLSVFLFITQIYLLWEINNIKSFLNNAPALYDEKQIKKGTEDSISLIETINIPVGGNLVAGSNYELGAGWTYTNGTFNHTSGYTDPLTIKFNVIPNTYYFAKFDTPAFSLPQDFTISVGNYLIENTYKEENNYNFTFLPTDGNNLVITPLPHFDGSINNLFIAEIIPGSEKKIEVEVLNVGENLNPYLTGFWNIALGDDTLKSLISGRSNIAFGHQTFPILQKNNQNIAIGTFCAQNMIDSYRNVFIGVDVAEFPENGGNNNIGIGTASLGNFESIGHNNIAIGNGSHFGGEKGTGGNYNIDIGMGAGFKNYGDKNTIIGFYAGNGKSQSNAVLNKASNVLLIGAETGSIDEFSFQNGDININNLIKGGLNREGLSITDSNFYIENSLNKGFKFQLNKTNNVSYLQIVNNDNIETAIGGIEFIQMPNTNTDMNSRREVALISGNLVKSSVEGQNGADIVISLKSPDGPFSDKFIFTNQGQIGVFNTAPEAMVDINGQSESMGALHINPGSLLTIPKDGTLEYDGLHLYFTINGVRKQLD